MEETKNSEQYYCRDLFHANQLRDFYRKIYLSWNKSLKAGDPYPDPERTHKAGQELTIK
jgi:hypothetical protein